jgi:Gpi18-like mannosyltransferase
VTDTISSQGPRRAVEDVVRVLPAWLVARVLVGAAYVIAIVVADRLTPGGRPHQIDEGLLAWDGTWYRDIATAGYGGLGDQSLRFFPLFPFAARLLGVGASAAVGPALVILANASSLVLLVFVRRLVVAEGKPPHVADRAVWYTALFPAAFVLAWGYAEALMLAAVVGGFLALRTRHWNWAVLAGIVAAASRPLGVVFAVPVAIELARTWPNASGRERAWGTAALAAPVVTCAAYLAWVRAEFGDWLLPFRVQDDLRATTLNPIARLWDGIQQVVGPERFGDGLHIPFVFVFVALVVVTFWRWPVSYGAFAAVVLVAALSAQNLNSLERYALNAFPIVLTLALLARDERVDRAVLTVSAGGFVALASLAWLGAYVP